MTNSSTSSATIIAVAVFENGRVAEGQGMTLIFDAQIYLGEDCPPLLAALRYFNSTNRAFDEIGFYFVIAKASPMVAKMESGARLGLLPGMEEMDYDIVGDIIRARLPSFQSIEPTFTPYVEICGTVSTVDDLARSFCIDAHQYVTALKPEPSSTNFRSLMPVECTFPDTARWKKSLSGKRFIVQPNRYVSIGGFIIGRKTFKAGDKNETERFRIEVDSITFLGRPVVASTGSSLHGATSTTPTPGRSKLKFSFSDRTPLNKRSLPDDNSEDGTPSKRSRTCQ
ncbi:hypothetical protein EV424DRAFT_1539873 [Suillus variegatus]|nr:hypothetical protein EV424DRAFT_1539873 [Suillus variegatus]